MTATFAIEDGKYRTRIDVPHCVLGSFLEDELGSSDLQLPFRVKSNLDWLEQAGSIRGQKEYGGNEHGVCYENGTVVVEHDYDLFPPTRITSDQFRELLVAWRDFVASGEKTRTVEL